MEELAKSDPMRKRAVHREEENEIKRFIEEDYTNAANSGDAGAYASLYMENAIWSPPNAPDRRGPSNIRFAYIAKNSDIEVTMNVGEHEIITDGFGFVSGMVKVIVIHRDQRPSVTYYYRALWHLRKINGTWKIERQIFTEKPTLDLV